MGYSHNLFNAQAISGYMKLPGNYQNIAQYAVRDFLTEYGFVAGEWTYLHEVNQHGGWCGVRFNVILQDTDKLPARELKQVAKHLGKYLADNMHVKRCYKHSENLQVYCGRITQKVADTRIVDGIDNNEVENDE